MKLVSQDLVQDLTLRALSVVVLASLVACLGFLVARSYLAHHTERVEVAIPEVAETIEHQTTTTARPTPVERLEVLLNPGVIYRCVDRGKVAYTDRPCGAEVPQRPAR